MIVGLAVALSAVSMAAGPDTGEAAARVRAMNHARLLMAKADWDYSGRLDDRDSAFVSRGRVTWAQALLRAARKVGIGGSDGLDVVEVRRFVLHFAGGDRILDDLEEIYLSRALRQEHGEVGAQDPKRPPRITLDLASAVRMLRYRGDRNGNGLVDTADGTDPGNVEQPPGMPDTQKTFAGGLLRYAARHGIGQRTLGERKLALILRRFAGADERLSPSERAQLDRTIRPA